jgi:membrane-bound metal-dependent hydrolase YbcI (DUF457 family)
MSFPPAHALIGAGLAEIAIAAKPLPRWRATALAGFLAVSPDFDIVLGLILGRGASYHGTFSHSIVAVIVIAMLGYALGGGRWSLVAGVGYGSHLLVDMLDDSGPTNLMLGWPFTGAQPYAIGKLFPKVPFETGGGFRASFLSLFEPEPLTRLAMQTLLAFVIYLGLLGIASLVRRRRLSARGAR